MILTTDTVQSMSLLVIGLLAIVILLRILVIVHKQAGKFKELEQRMKLMEGSEQAELLEDKKSEEDK